MERKNNNCILASRGVAYIIMVLYLLLLHAKAYVCNDNAEDWAHCGTEPYYKDLMSTIIVGKRETDFIKIPTYAIGTWDIDYNLAQISDSYNMAAEYSVKVNSTGTALWIFTTVVAKYDYIYQFKSFRHELEQVLEEMNNNSAYQATYNNQAESISFKAIPLLEKQEYQGARP